MSKTMSHFAQLANQANALMSSGPRTDAGKAISKMNAVKHGCRSNAASIDENPEEVQAARERWIGSVNPVGEVALAVTDLSFRLYRQLNRSFAAEDAAIHVRIEATRDTIVADRNQFIEESAQLFETDPFEGYPRLRVTAEGVESLLNRLEQLDDTIQFGSWTERQAVELSAIEGLRKPDEFLTVTAAFFERAKGAERIIKLSHNSQDAQVKIEHDRAVIEYKNVQPEIAKYTPLIRDRIRKETHRLQEERITAQVEEAEIVRRTIDLAKFDDSPEGKLRRRYISDAQRDFLRAYKEMMKVCKPTPAKVETPQPAGVTQIPQASRVPRGPQNASPNEAISDYDDEGDDADSSAARTDVRGRKTA